MKSAKKEVFVIGGGGHAQVLISIINDLDHFTCKGYTDLTDKGSILGCPYLGKDEKILNSKYINHAVLGISYLKNIKESFRKDFIKKLINHSHLKFPVVISNNSNVDQDVKILQGSAVINKSTINTGVEIGEFCVLNTNSTIDHNCILGTNVQVGPGAVICGDVNIADNVFIGAGATIIDGLSICEDVIIGAGSVVTKSITRAGIYFGSPASLRYS